MKYIIWIYLKLEEHWLYFWYKRFMFLSRGNSYWLRPSSTKITENAYAQIDFIKYYEIYN